MQDARGPVIGTCLIYYIGLLFDIKGYRLNIRYFSLSANFPIFCYIGYKVDIYTTKHEQGKYLDCAKLITHDSSNYGDIVNSRGEAAGKWQSMLKHVLSQYGKEPKSWELYRGDSFQLRLEPDSAFGAAIHIKSSIRQLAGLDVRMAIGVGSIETDAKKSDRSNRRGIYTLGWLL
ncbi:hypothetical protein LWM68_16785 [Niabella sp. W65]|nr:hypothetical protein [Niabella sp. W65]MCH7364265.1 hypothetical protein [Niabella sp. W65]